MALYGSRVFRRRGHGWIGAVQSAGPNARVERRDPFERLVGDRCVAALINVEEVAPQMRPTEGKRERLAGHGVRDRLVSRIAVALHHAVIAIEQLERVNRAAAGCSPAVLHSDTTDGSSAMHMQDASHGSIPGPRRMSAVREHNEDSYLARPDAGIWAVADGMGGLDAGELASATVIQALDSIEAPRSAAELLAWCEQRVVAANSTLYELGRRRRGLIGHHDRGAVDA